MRIPLLAVLALGFTACDNMQHQANRRPLTPSPFFRDGASARHPPAHTVAIDAPPEPPQPQQGTALSELLRGRALFDANCSPCHGADGYGNGIVVRRGFPRPPSLHSESQRRLSDAEILAVIQRGKGTMYPQAYKVAPDDQRRIVAYIRALQLSQSATLADVPQEHRTGLSGP